jgi:hypothetical protein
MGEPAVVGHLLNSLCDLAASVAHLLVIQHDSPDEGFVAVSVRVEKYIYVARDENSAVKSSDLRSTNSLKHSAIPVVSPSRPLKTCLQSFVRLMIMIGGSDVEV